MPRGDREKLKADCEDGFTKVANLILEAMALAKLNGTQKGICLYLWRRTYGWNHSEDAISLAEFAAACGTTKTYVSRQLNDLIDKNIIRRVSYQPGKTPVYTFETNVADWDQCCLESQALSKNIKQGLYERVIDELPEKITLNLPQSPEKPVKAKPLKTIRKTVKKQEIYPSDSLPYQLSELLLNKILEHLPGFKKPDLQKWAWQMEAMLRLDKRDPEEVKTVIHFAQKDAFWRTNILSIEKLRKQYDQLNSKRLQNRASSAKIYSEGIIMGEEDDYERFFK